MPLWTKQQYADHFKVSPTTVDKWIAEGKVVPLRTPGGSPRFRPLNDDEDAAALRPPATA